MINLETITILAIVVGPISVLAGIWLKDHLDNKRIFSSTKTQKAIKAYALADDLAYCLTMQAVLCGNLIKDKKYPYLNLVANYPDTSLELLKKLELLIIEHFIDLNIEFRKIQKIVLNHCVYLLDIPPKLINTSEDIVYSDFKDQNENFKNDKLNAIKELQGKLQKKYFNKYKRCVEFNFFRYTFSISKREHYMKP